MAGECAECRNKKATLQRRSTNQTEPTTVPPIVHDVLRSPGQLLDPATRAFFEPHFGHDFSSVQATKPRVDISGLSVGPAAAIRPLSDKGVREVEVGHTDCDWDRAVKADEPFKPKSGKVKVNVGGDKCTLPCTAEHEAVHIQQVTPICTTYFDCYTGALARAKKEKDCKDISNSGERKKCEDLYTEFYRLECFVAVGDAWNAEKWECEAYKKSLSCAEKELTKADQDCKEKLEEYAESAKKQIAKYCKTEKEEGKKPEGSKKPEESKKPKDPEANPKSLKEVVLHARRLQRVRAAGTGEEQNVAPPIVHEVLRAPGQPLDAQTRTFMEPRFGYDFSQVRVHTGTRAAESARAVNALAYTVGRDVVFGASQYAPRTGAGTRLIAHELTHVMQQNSGGQMQSKLTINQPGDAFEHEADAAAEHVMAGAQASEWLTSRDLSIQREAPGGDAEKKHPEKKEAGEVIADGLKIVAEQAADNNPQVKKVIIDPIKDQLKREWDRLGTGEQAATIGLGAATLGMAGGAMLSDPGGRKRLEGLNLAAPFTLIPYMPLSSFKYTLPSGSSPDKRLFKFETGFKADDLINLRTESRGLPKMALSVNMQWGYDPITERLTVLGGDATLGLVSGLSLSAGAYKDVLRPQQTFMGPEGQMTQIKKSIPEFDKPEPVPDVRIMVNVDLMKFKPGDLKRQIQSIF